MESRTQADFDKEVIAFYESKYPIDVKPVLDGIFDIVEYPKQDYKILWLLKEPYGDAKDVKIEIFEEIEVYEKIKTWDMIIHASYCILNNTYPEELSGLSIEKKQDVLKKIAFMNIKKEPGETKSKERIISNAYAINKTVLKDQINFINPDIIICGNTLHHFKDDGAFGLSCDLTETDDLNENNFGVWYMERENKLFIEAFHPSGRGWLKNTIEPLQKTINHWKKIRNGKQNS